MNSRNIKYSFFSPMCGIVVINVPINSVLTSSTSAYTSPSDILPVCSSKLMWTTVYYITCCLMGCDAGFQPLSP